jgi:hypothetical protein
MYQPRCTKRDVKYGTKYPNATTATTKKESYTKEKRDNKNLWIMFGQSEKGFGCGQCREGVKLVDRKTDRTREDRSSISPTLSLSLLKSPLATGKKR